MRRKKLVPYQISIDALYELKYCKGVIENKNKYNMYVKSNLIACNSERVKCFVKDMYKGGLDGTYK